MLMRKTNPAGDVVGLHAVFLDADGRKASFEDPGKSAKKSFGRGGVVVLRVGGPLRLVGEGPEDMVTVLAARPHDTVICSAGAGTLSRIVDYVGGDGVVLVADRDDAGLKNVDKTAALLTERGVSVSVAMPPEGIKDANALLKGRDLEAVQVMIDAAEPRHPVEAPSETESTVETIGEVPGNDSKPTQRDLVIEVGLSAELWHDADHVAYATIEVSGHREHHQLGSQAFKRWLLAEFGRRHPRTIGERTIPGTPSTQAKTDALNALESAAAGPERCPVVRIGEHDGKLYLDLGRTTWEAVEIDAQGWRVVAEAPLPFLRPSGVRALPVPVTGGSINELRDLLNVDTENDFRLVVSFLVSMLRRQGPFPVLIVSGEQGAAKSTFCKVVRRLVDPNHADLRTAPRSEQDLLVAAQNGWVVCLDNLSFVNADLSDAICQFLIAVAIGMISPGPVVITATFVGYLVAGFWGSLASTIGIFLPSFILVLVAAPILARHRANPNVQGFVKGAYAAAIGTILGACILLGRIAIGDWLTVLVGAASLAVLFRWKVSNPLLIAATAVIGLIAFPLLQPNWVMVR
jgi:chromate transport protein ChrA